MENVVKPPRIPVTIKSFTVGGERGVNCEITCRKTDEEGADNVDEGRPVREDGTAVRTCPRRNNVPQCRSDAAAASNE